MAEESKPQDEITPESTETPVETPLSPEDLQVQVKERDDKILQLQQTVSKHAATEQGLRKQINTIDSLHKRMDDQEETKVYIKERLDEISGASAEQETPPISRHRKEFEEKQKQRTVNQQPPPSAGEAEVPVDANAKAFFEYLKENSLSDSDAVVQEAMKQPTAQHGLSHIKTTIDRLTEEKAQQKIKAMGLTGSEATGPSASGQPSLEDLEKMPMDQYAKWRDKQ